MVMANDTLNIIIGCKNVNSNHTHNTFSKLLFKTAHTASNDIANIVNSTTCYQQISIQHISPTDKCTRNNLPYHCLVVLS